MKKKSNFVVVVGWWRGGESIMMCFAEDIVNVSFFVYLAWFVSESNIYACFMHNEAFFIKKLATVYIFYFQVYTY